MDTDGDNAVPQFKAQPRFHPTVPRDWTISIAVPTSLITEYTSPIFCPCLLLSLTLAAAV